MLVCFSHQSVASLASVSAEYGHDVILHEGEAVSPSFSCLIWHDALNSNDEYIRHVIRATTIRQEPRAQVSLVIGLYASHVP